MDALMLRDEATKERIRLAEEFLDPSEFNPPLSQAVVRPAGRTESDCAAPT